MQWEFTHLKLYKAKFPSNKAMVDFSFTLFVYITFSLTLLDLTFYFQR